MINISNSFVYDFRHLPPKYTISTLQSVDIADNQDSCGCIWKFSRIAVFVTDENGNFIIRHADKIDGNIFVADCRPGKYAVSAEYVNPDTDNDNIILGRVNVELKAYQPIEVTLKINLNKIKIQKQ